MTPLVRVQYTRQSSVGLPSRPRGYPKSRMSIEIAASGNVHQLCAVGSIEASFRGSEE
jgi:hypothetical protein